jgi:hypothetical protein
MSYDIVERLTGRVVATGYGWYTAKILQQFVYGSNYIIQRTVSALTDITGGSR